MNRLDTTPLGGVPFDWDDWKWEQDGVREAFFGLISAWGIDPADSFIISGCTSTLNGLNYDISEGYIALSGEIYKVDAHSVVVALAGGFAHQWAPLISYDPAGFEATKNAGTVNTYENRRAHVVNALIVGAFMPMLSDDIHQKVFEKISPKFVFETIDLSSSLDVLQNDDYGGIGNFIASPQPPQFGSFLKYQITGKLIHITFHIIDLQTTDSATSLARSFVMRNLPFQFKNSISQFGICDSRSTDIDTDNGQSRIEAFNDKIVFQISRVNGNPVAYNETVEMATSPSKNHLTKVVPVPARTWTLSGCFIAELN